ncbi:hypothetical protein R6Q59_013534 [Mikania micrantha]
MVICDYCNGLLILSYHDGTGDLGMLAGEKRLTYPSLDIVTETDCLSHWSPKEATNVLHLLRMDGRSYHLLCGGNIPTSNRSNSKIQGGPESKPYATKTGKGGNVVRLRTTGKVGRRDGGEVRRWGRRRRWETRRRWEATVVGDATVGRCGDGGGRLCRRQVGRRPAMEELRGLVVDEVRRGWKSSRRAWSRSAPRRGRADVF